MREYTLNGLKSKDEEKGSHRFAVVKALETIKKGTAGQIIAQAKRDRSLSKSKMDISKAIHWMIAKMFNAKELKGQKIAKKDPTAKASNKLAKKARKAVKRIKKAASAGAEQKVA
jgi:hypothetical protein